MEQHIEKGQKTFAFIETYPTTQQTTIDFVVVETLLTTPQNNCTLTIKAIVMSCCSPSLNTFNIGEILQSVELMCKHTHNNWEMSSELVMEL
jgi:hypothetical protein